MERIYGYNNNSHILCELLLERDVSTFASDYHVFLESNTHFSTKDIIKVLKQNKSIENKDIIDTIEYIENKGIIMKNFYNGNIMNDSNGKVYILDFGESYYDPK